MLLWSTHHADPVYVRESRTLRLAAVEVEAAGGAITLEFPVASRPTLCISPRERVFVEVHAQEL